MSNNKMLIDATHPEETRVVVVRDKRVEDFDFEAASRKPLRGNIYLAKVIRVEPSLQACFVEYGGNRHGFLAFSEIHPDYYQIPQADRAALLADERAAADEAEEPQPKRSRRRRRPERSASAAETGTKPDITDEDESADDEVDARAVDDDDNERPAPDSDEGDDDPADAGPDDGDDEDDRREGLDAADDDAAGAVEEEEAGEERARTAAAAVRTATDADVVTSDVAAAAQERADEVAATDAGEEPTSLARAAEQVAENIAADVETTDVAPRNDAEAAPAPADTVDPGAAHEVSAATSETQDPGETGEPASAVPEGEGGEPEGGDKPAPRRRRTPRPRTRKTAEGLADPQVSDVDDRRGDDEDDDATDDNANDDNDAGSITSMGNSDAMEEIPERRRHTPRRQYKIQEVIKRRQIILVQVVKEERGTKGAALTTYLSLAGRYCVLMPNTDRGGGVSRKITDTTDRKRLKSIVGELEVPEGMGVILRTAGAARTKTEIKRDFEYLLRLWENVRELTLKSIAPQLVYEEGNLIKRSIRDLYSKEIEEVLVSGEDAYREAKDFMRMLMPSHAKNVQPYREPTPIFTAFQVEPQLDAMFSPQVTLPSKGYIVINPTEALVAIDVNSGRSTKEANIEETAYKTNLEAADEVARQLRLRDLAGLIVIDFIDMDDKRHNRAVEKRLKDALKLDRSRIQVGHISPFGLLEMSRQRIRQGMVETSMVACPHCAGTGQVRSTQSVALHCLRTLEEHLLKDCNHHVTLRTSAAVALYILNQKRAHLNALEQRFGLEIGVDADETLGGQLLQILRGAEVDREPGAAPPIALISPGAVIVDEDEEEEEDEPEAEAEVEAGAVSADDEAEREEDGSQGAAGERSSRRRRRRRRRGGNGSGDAPREAEARTTTEPSDEDGGDDEAEDADSGEEMEAREGETAEEGRNRRRRGRRGGRRHRRENGGRETDAEGVGLDETRAENAEPSPAVRHVPIVEAGEDATATADEAVTAAAGETGTVEPVEPVAPSAEGDAAAGSQPAEETAAEAEAESTEAETREAAASPVETAPAPDVAPAGETEPAPRTPEPAPATTEAEPRDEERQEERRPRRVGWWQRRFLS